MAIKHLLKMTEVDRYTADGCEALNKAREADVEDRTYKTGEISQKTGLQKQPDGSWAPPKKGGNPGAKSGEGTLKPSRKPDQKKNPHIKNPDVLGMTANGARKRMEAFGAQFVENKNGKDYFKTTSGDLVEVEYGNNKKVLSSTTYTGGEKPEQAYPSTQGHDMQSYMSKLREEGWENQGWERNAANEARGIYKKGDKTIRVKKNWDGSLGGVSEIKTSTESKPTENNLKWEETRMASGKIYDLKSQGKRIIEQYDPETETKTFKLRDLNNSRSPDKEFKSLEEAKAAAVDSAPRILTGDCKIKIRQTQDKVYQIGEISEKTGLQKQPDGSWAPPKKGGLGSGTGKKETGNKEQKKQKHFMANSQHQFEAASGTANSEIDQANLKSIKSFMDEEHATFKNALYSKAETLARRGARGTPDPESEKSLLKFAEAAGMADDLKLYLKEEVNSKYEFGGAESKPGRDTPLLKNKDHIDLAKEVKSNTMPGSDWTAEEIAKEWKLGKADAEEVKKEFDKIKESKPTGAIGNYPGWKPNKVEKVDNSNRPYRIEGTQFYFETPEEAETAIVAGTRGEGKTYAKPSSDATINEIQNALGFKLDSEYAGKYSMDDFIKKTGKDEYGVRVWSFGTNSKGTLIDTIVEGYNKPDATIKKENGEWRLHYTDRDGKKMIVTPKGREWPTSDSAPRVLTGDTKIRVRKT